MLFQLLLGDQILVVKIVWPLYSFNCSEEVSEDVVTESFQDILTPKTAHGATVSLQTALFA